MSRLRWLLPVLALALVAVAQPPSKQPPPPGAAKFSHARIVRVSLVAGPAEINQQDGRGWQKLAVNAPLSEGDQIRTGPDGRAVVEFEQGSTVKLIPNSQVAFQRLELTPKGERLSDVAVTAGSVFFSLRGNDAPGFRALFAEGVATVPDNKAEFRVDVGAASAGVRVLDGRAEIATANDAYLLKKNDVLTLATTTPAELAKNKTQDTWDEWSEDLDKGRSEVGNGYVASDLAAYGGWQNGWWYPANMPLGWNPFMNGNWFYDPTFGYMWDSFYPWGWSPFHYGMWWDSPMGWAWSPMGGAYFVAGPQMLGDPVGLGAVRTPPPAPPPGHRVNTPVIRAVTTGGVTVAAGRLGTPAWYEARARINARQRLSPALRLNRGQMAAAQRARSTLSFNRQQAAWAHRQRATSDPFAWERPAMSAAQSSAPMSNPVRMAAPSPVAHGGGASSTPRVPR